MQAGIACARGFKYSPIPSRLRAQKPRLPIAALKPRDAEPDSDHPRARTLLRRRAQDLVYIAEYCGGGFGSKGNAYPQMAIPAHMSRKINRPVMMRVSRQEEYAIGQGRAGLRTLSVKNRMREFCGTDARSSSGYRLCPRYAAQWRPAAELTQRFSASICLTLRKAIPPIVSSRCRNEARLSRASDSSRGRPNCLDNATAFRSSVCARPGSPSWIRIEPCASCRNRPFGGFWRISGRCASPPKWAARDRQVKRRAEQLAEALAKASFAACPASRA
jgi:hypothetical protein